MFTLLLVKMETHEILTLITFVLVLTGVIGTLVLILFKQRQAEIDSVTLPGLDRYISRLWGISNGKRYDVNRSTEIFRIIDSNSDQSLATIIFITDKANYFKVTCHLNYIGKSSIRHFLISINENEVKSFIAEKDPLTYIRMFGEPELG